MRKKIVLLRKSLFFMKERRLYIRPEDVPKYREMGYTVYRGKRGGLYIDLDERPRVSGRAGQELDNISGSLEEKMGVFDSLGLGISVNELLNMLIELKNGNEGASIDNVFESLDALRNELSSKFANNEISEEGYRELSEMLDKIEEWIDKKLMDDVLGIKLYDVVVPGVRVYDRVVKKLGVVSKFGNINAIKYIGERDGLYEYYIDMGELGKFDVVYDRDGNVRELSFIVNGRVYSGEEGVVKWLDSVGRDKLMNVVNAFKEYYGATESGRRLVIEVTRPNAEIKKIELLRPVGGRRGRIRWILYLIVQAKKLGIAWQDIGELIHIMSKMGILKLIMEMFSVVSV